MIKHRDHIKKFVREEDYNEQKLKKAMSHLIDVVIRRHFDYYDDEQELRSMARERFIDIMDNDLDPDNEGYINYLYTGIRNKLSNYLSNQKKTFSRTESGSAEDHRAVMEKRKGDQPKAESLIDTDELLSEAERFVSNENEELKKHFAGLFLFQFYYTEGNVQFG